MAITVRRISSSAAKPLRVKKPTGGALKLPTETKEICDDFYRYATLIYGRPGIGKTTFGASFPDAIVFSCERVSKGVPCFDFNAENGGVKNWKVLLDGVKLLEENPGKFKTVVIDTVRAAYAHCMEYVCKQKGIEHPQDEGYGKAWDALKNEFAAAMDRIWATGRGIVFTAHAKEAEITAHSGEKYTRIQPALQGQAYDYIKAKTDFVFYAEFVRDTAGKQRRILITTGDEIIDAKHAGDLSLYLPMKKDDGAALVARAFSGEDVGIPTEEIRASVQTGKAATEFVNKQRLKTKKGGKK